MVSTEIRLVIFCAAEEGEAHQSAKTRPGSDWLVSGAPVAKLRLKLKKGEKTTRPFRYDLNQVPYDYTAAVTNRISSDRVPGGLWTEVCDIVQEAVDQDHPQEKVMQTGKVVVQGGLTNS